MNNLNDALNTIKEICDEWNKVKESRKARGGWLFDYKLYDLSQKCEDEDDFNIAAEFILDEWKEAVRTAAGYAPEKWDYSKYFEHDKHHGSYFTFHDDIESAGSLDFWAGDVGLELDVSNNPWFTPFEKAIHGCYNVTRFSTDRLTPEEYTHEEITEITDHLINTVIPALREKLEERKLVIKVYDDIKARQCDYVDLTV